MSHKTVFGFGSLVFANPLIIKLFDRTNEHQSPQKTEDPKPNYV